MQRNTLNQELRRLQRPPLTIRSSGSNRQAKTPDGGSNATQTGDGNSVVQIGSSHEAETNGNSNETMQDGSDNGSVIHGDKNLAAQIGNSNISRIGAIAAVASKKVYQHGENLRLFSMDAATSFVGQLSDFPRRAFRSLQEMPKTIRERFIWLRDILGTIRKS